MGAARLRRSQKSQTEKKRQESCNKKLVVKQEGERHQNGSKSMNLGQKKHKIFVAFGAEGEVELSADPNQPTQGWGGGGPGLKTPLRVFPFSDETD